jgi:hypothetical protein
MENMKNSHGQKWRHAWKMGRGWGIPLPTFSIKAKGPKVGLQLGLVPTVWEVIRAAQLDKLPSVHDETEGRISTWNG